MGKILATDLDGTLFYPKHRVHMLSERTLKILRELCDKGDKLVLVTGRNFPYSRKVVKRINRSIDIVGCNGAYVMHDDKIIASHTIESSLAKEVVDFLVNESGAKGIFVMADDGRFILNHYFKNPLYNIGYFAWTFIQLVYREPLIVCKKAFNEIITSNKAFKIMPMFGIGKKNVLRAEEMTRVMQEKFKDKLEIAWSNECVEISPKGINKSNQLKFLLNYLKITNSDVYVVGDSGNDIPMFNDFHENSFCLSHSPLSVSKYANKVIDQFEDIEKYL